MILFVVVSQNIDIKHDTAARAILHSFAWIFEWSQIECVSARVSVHVSMQYIIAG